MTVGQELEEESELQLKGHLEVLERLGEGASGEVRKARYKPSGMIMAMKVCRLPRLACEYCNC